MKHDYAKLSNQQLADLVRDYSPRSSVSKEATQELMNRNTQLKEHLVSALSSKRGKQAISEHAHMIADAELISTARILPNEPSENALIAALEDDENVGSTAGNRFKMQRLRGKAHELESIIESILQVGIEQDSYSPTLKVLKAELERLQKELESLSKNITESETSTASKK